MAGLGTILFTLLKLSGNPTGVQPELEPTSLGQRTTLTDPGGVVVGAGVGVALGVGVGTGVGVGVSLT